MSPETSLPESIQRLFQCDALPRLTAEPRPGVKPVAAIERDLDQTAGLKGAAHDLLKCAAFLWHDHLDAAHRIAQAIHSAEGSMFHGIIHRREGDYSNARYWFGQAGRHPCFLTIEKKLGARFPAAHPLAKRLLTGRGWDAFAFIDQCEAAVASASSLRADLEEIQQMEFDSLVAFICGAPA